MGRVSHWIWPNFGIGGVNRLVIFSAYGLECALFVLDSIGCSRRLESFRGGIGEWFSAQLVP
jgi:hypothetical protein